MAVTHTTTTRNAIADEVATLANAGTTCKLVIGTSSLALPSTGVLATISLADFGSASSGTITSASSGNFATAGASGTAAIGMITTDGTTEIFRGACGTSGTEIVLNTTSITSGDLVTLTANITYTAPT